MSLEQTLQPTTALEAINDMLASIGQGSVNSLEENESVDATGAISVLVNTSREVQERGWFFNTDYNYPLVPGDSGEIVLPPGMLQFEPEDSIRGRIVERARKLYDRDNHTFIFEAGTVVYGRVVWLLGFEDLPQAARTYIHRLAGRIFQSQREPDQLLYQFTKEREQEALAALTGAQLRAERPNAISDNARVLSTVASSRLISFGGSGGSPYSGSTVVPGLAPVGSVTGNESYITLRADLSRTDAGYGGALVGFKQLGTLAADRTVLDKLRERVTPEDYGAVGDGVADDTAALSNAIAYLNSIGWAKALYLAGTYKLTAAPTLITSQRSPTIVGNGARILLEYAAGDGITFYSGVGGLQIQNPRISGVEFDSTTVTRTSGAAVRFLNVADPRVANCTFYNQYTGVKVGVYQYPTVIDSAFLECARGIELDQGSGGTLSAVRMQTGSGTTPTPGTIGLLLTNASGVMVANTDIARCDTGISGQPAAGAVVQFLFLVNTLLDTCTWGLKLSTANGGAVSSIFASNSWFSSCIENGIFASGVKNMRLNACEILLNKRDGVNLISCEQVRILGGTIGWNNTLNTASGGGVIASGVAGLSIRGVLFTNKSGWVSYGATSNQNYGVVFSGSASSSVDLLDNTMVDHSTGDVLASVTPTGVSQVRGNRTTRSNSIASATNISVEAMHEFFDVTGTTNVQNIGLPVFTNQVIRLRTVDGCTISDGFNFKLAGNFVGTAGSMLTLMGIPGVGWVETARAIV